ncbi:amidohydrolase family protein [Rhodococcus sp. P1Y]|uniref:amidohydrolase family protein n=1 Tax=Rhodococcus sp. P1Y TaxID=1302308 RepID=UPI000EB48344|nr:amidohydrolase family protein [Rhodococcus sp. P1Y]AYJ50301.1 amidohydrolase [Rhodococcus sp. P1Y]
MLIVNGFKITNEPVSVRIDGERIVETDALLHPTPGETVLDARGGTVIPGLHDHHLHLRSIAAFLHSLPLGPPAVENSQQMRTVLREATARQDGWIRAVGYHESVDGDLDRFALDLIRPGTPVRIQHRSGAMWIVNSVGLAALGLHDHPDGRLFRQDHLMLKPSSSAHVGLEEVSARLSSMGVTGCTDATPNMTVDQLDYLEAEVRAGRLRQTLHVLSADDSRPNGFLTFGPVKRILDDTHLDVDELTGWISFVHAQGQAVAIHCVTLPQLVTAVIGFKTAGVLAGDRIEHAAVTPDALLKELSQLHITVVTQPNFVTERGDHYLDTFSSSEHRHLWRLAAFDRSAILVAGSTDAPFGALDPWATMRAARDRTTASGRILGLDESVSALRALRLFSGAPATPGVPRRITAGERADLCILAEPPVGVLAQLDRELVSLTMIGGSVTYEA